MPEAKVIGPVPPSYIESLAAEQIIPAGYPPPPSPPTRTYVSTQGDMWDLISLRVYGMRRRDDHLMHKLIEANYPMRNVSSFPAGLTVTVPEVITKRTIPLVPWKKADMVTVQL